MLSFESYWKQIAKDEQQTENTQAQNIQVLTTPDPVQSDTKTDTTLQSDNTTTPQDATITNSDKSRKRAIFGTMNLEAIENNIEAHERKRKLKRKLSKSTNPDSDSTQTPITAPSAKDNLDQTEYEGMDLDIMETNMEVHRKRLKKRPSKKQSISPNPDQPEEPKVDEQNQNDPDKNPSPKSSPKKPKVDSSNNKSNKTTVKTVSSPKKKRKLTNTPKKPKGTGKTKQPNTNPPNKSHSLKDSIMADHDDPKPLRVIIPNKLKQKTLNSFF